MASDDLPWTWRVARAASIFLPIAWLSLRGQIDVFGWSQANADSVNPVRSPAREIAGAILYFPLFYWPPITDWFRTRTGSNALVLQMAANALCWELFLAPVVNRRLALSLFLADGVAESVWPGSGLFRLLGR